MSDSVSDKKEGSTSYDPESKLLGISIVSYFSAKSVDSLLTSLQDICEDKRVSVIIKDNSGASDSIEEQALKKLVYKFSSPSFKVTIHHDRANVGYAKGNNLAVALLLQDEPSLIWVLNPDCSVSGSTKELDSLSNSRLTIFGTPTLQAGVVSDGFSRMNTFTGRSYRSNSKRCGVDFFGVTYPGGHSMLFSPDAWNALDGFSEEYFLYMEEADLVTRASHHGIRFGVAVSLLINHEGGGTTSIRSGQSLTKSTRTYEEATRSRVTYIRRYRHRRLIVFLSARVLYAVYLCGTGQIERSKAVFRGLTRRG